MTIRDILFGWAGGAVAAAALALIVGIGVGQQMDGGLPMMAAAEEEVSGLFLSDSGFLPEDFL